MLVNSCSDISHALHCCRAAEKQCKSMTIDAGARADLKSRQQRGTKEKDQNHLLLFGNANSLLHCQKSSRKKEKKKNIQKMCIVCTCAQDKSITFSFGPSFQLHRASRWPFRPRHQPWSLQHQRSLLQEQLDPLQFPCTFQSVRPPCSLQRPRSPELHSSYLEPCL